MRMTTGSVSNPVTPQPNPTTEYAFPRPLFFLPWLTVQGSNAGVTPNEVYKSGPDYQNMPFDMPQIMGCSVPH